MSKERKQYSSEFKAKVALSAIRGEETVLQLAARHGLHPTQINSWKRQLIEQAAEVFSKDQSAELAFIQHTGCRFLYPSIGSCHPELRLPGDIQHRARRSIYRRSMNFYPEKTRHSD